MIKQTDLGGSFTLTGTSMTANRMGYGAMQLAGPGVWGPPRDVDGAIAVLREAVDSGVNHIDTSDYYGPHVTNQLIKRALHPYPGELVIVSKLGARRGADKSWIPALSRQELIDGNDDAFIDDLASQGIAYVPFFPLGGFTPLQSSELDTAAARLGVTPMQLALAWLLQRSPNIMLIPGTSSLKHLRENLQASQLHIPAEVLAILNSIGKQEKEF